MPPWPLLPSWHKRPRAMPSGHLLWQVSGLLGSADAHWYYLFRFGFSLSPLSSKVQLSKAH